MEDTVLQNLIADEDDDLFLLLGEYRHQVDEKGRIRIPSKLKEGLGDKQLIIRGPNKCLWILSKKEAKKLLATQFNDVSLTDANRIKAERSIFSNAAYADEDKQGRISLPAKLIEHAGLKKNVVSIGLVSRVELWDEEAWDEYSKGDAEHFDEYLAQLSGK